MAERGSPLHLIRAMATCAGILATMALVAAFVNWAWAFRGDMHASAFLVLLLGLAALAGAAAGSLLGAVRHLLALKFGDAIPRPALLAVAAGIAFPIASTGFLKLSVRLVGVEQARILILATWVLLMAGAIAGTWALARLLERHVTRSGTRAGILSAAAVWVSVCAVAAGAIYQSSGPAGPGGDLASTSTGSSPPHIILISLDTLRPDHLSALGYPRRTSTNLDSLIGEGALFTQAISSSSWTIPSHATLLTGQSPSRIGPSMIEGAASGALYLPDNALTLTEILRDHGYSTAAFISSAAMQSGFGFDQGFDWYDEILPPATQSASRRIFLASDVRFLLGIPSEQFLGFLNPLLIRLSNLVTDQHHVASIHGEAIYSRHPNRSWNLADEVNAKLRGYLESRPAGPQFLFIHYFDPHDPYDAPPPFLGRWADQGRAPERIDEKRLFETVMKDGQPLTEQVRTRLIDRYDEEILYMDEALGDLRDTLHEQGLLENAILVLFSDHGESFGLHGDLFHGHALYEELIRILFSIRAPGRVEPSTTIDRQVRGVDIMPTILDLAGIELAAGVEGVSLVPLLGDESASLAPIDSAFSELYARGWGGAEAFMEDHLSIRKDGWKLVLKGGVPRLYRLADDPDELRDLAGDHPEVVASLQSHLVDWRAGGFQRTRTDEHVDPHRIQQLEALGYVNQ